MKATILDLRKSHGARLRESLGDLFAPLAPDRFAPGLTVLENALFGRLSENAGGRAEELRRVTAEVLAEGGARELVMQLIYDVPIALSGANLPALFAEPLAFTRATIKKPDILILDAALASFDRDTQKAVFHNLREMLPETTILYLNDQFENEGVFVQFLEIRGGRLVSDEVGADEAEAGAAGADLNRKLRALQQTDLFSGLDRRQLRLLAFGARWYRAEPGEVVFYKDDAPTDGAYMLIEGEAGLYLPRSEGEEDQLIAKVGPGTLVGELGLIRNEPRALTMRAEGELTCLRIGAEEFLAVVEHDASVAFKLLQVVAGYVSSCAQHRPDLALDRGEAVLVLGEGDARGRVLGTFQGALEGLRRGLERERHPRVPAGHRVEEQGQVGHVAGHRPLQPLGQEGGRRRAAAAASGRGAQPQHAAMRRGRAQRAHQVRAMRQPDLARRQRGRRADRGSARVERDVPGVAGGAEHRVGGVAAGAELGRVGLAHDQPAARLEALDQRIAGLGRDACQRGVAEAGGHARHVGEILGRDGQPGQPGRVTALAPGQRGDTGACALGAAGGHGVDRRFDRVDARGRGGNGLFRPDLPLAQARDHLARGQGAERGAGEGRVGAAHSLPQNSE